MTTRQTSIGIDDMALYVPALYLELSDLATARGIAFEKLKNGLDLERMAVPDLHEDAATMAAEATLELIQKNKLNPATIGRIYLGTESALDGAKPTATYAMGMIEQALEANYGPRSLRRCDVVDMTFACIAATDALQNCMDWVRANPGQKAIVIASDIAKYELASTGEYTQGAGAVAILVTANPRLLAFSNIWGVGTESVHDFFKPRRSVEKQALLASVLSEVNIQNGQVESVMNSLIEKNNMPFAAPDKAIEIFREMPVFDGQYSNTCYLNRAIEAMNHFQEQTKGYDKKPIFDRWSRLIFHLPYAAHARRIGVDMYLSEMVRIGKIDAFLKKAKIVVPSETDFADSKSYGKAQNAYMKSISETADYQQFVTQKLSSASKASSQVGNVYTASIFLALLSALESELANAEDVTNKKYGFVAYGSGSKAKVFEATLQANWRSVVAGFNVFQKLEQRQQISFDEYQALHTGHANESIKANITDVFSLQSIGETGQLEGARLYTKR